MPRKGNRSSVADLKETRPSDVELKETRPSDVELKKITDEDINENNKDEENRDVEEIEHEDESELEEDVDDSNLNLQALEFHQFMRISEEPESGAPVLERIAGSQPRPIFVGGIPRGTETSGDENSGDKFRYVPGAAENQETKYFAELGTNAPEPLDLTRVGRTGGFREEINQQRFFMQSEPKIGPQSQERFERPERFNVEQAGRRNPLERPETKYEKYRPKLPKS